jgi:1-acyl-sn-glycerol-3-phosphate acyltransferase
LKSRKPRKDRITPYHLFTTFWGWTMFLSISTLLLCFMPLLSLIALLFDRNKVFISYVVRVFFYTFYFLNFPQKITFNRNGVTAPTRGERRVYVINHASIFDSILMYSLPGSIKSLVKEYYTRLPIIGQVAVLAGNMVLPDEIGSQGDQINLYMKIIEQLESGSSMIIFPEGTRSKDSKIGRFQTGSFKIAQDTRADIVPVVFDSWNIIRPGTFWIRDVHHTLQILDPIPYESFKNTNYRKVSRLVRARMIEGLLNVRDSRRETEPRYYRHIDKFKAVDDEMRRELAALKQRLAEDGLTV